jgi:hypothetical protein
MARLLGSSYASLLLEAEAPDASAATGVADADIANVLSGTRAFLFAHSPV